MSQGARLIPTFLRYWLFVFALLFSFTGAISSANAADAAKNSDSKAAYTALADILSDASSRDALIAELRDSAKTGKPPTPPLNKETTAPPRSDSFAEQLDTTVQGYLAAAQNKLNNVVTTLKAPPHKAFNPDTFWPALSHFLLTVAVTFAIFLSIRFFCHPVL